MQSQSFIKQDVGKLVLLIGDGDLALRPLGFIAKTFAVGIYQDGAIIKKGVLGMLPSDQQTSNKGVHHELRCKGQQAANQPGEWTAGGEELGKGHFVLRRDKANLGAIGNVHIH